MGYYQLETNLGRPSSRIGFVATVINRHPRLMRQPGIELTNVMGSGVWELHKEISFALLCATDTIQTDMDNWDVSVRRRTIVTPFAWFLSLSTVSAN